jgi:RHS repeat-associated protein
MADQTSGARWAPADYQAYESTEAFIDTYWPITDHQGSVRDVLSAPGVRSEHIRYSGFGQIVEVRNGSTIDPTKTPTVSYAYTGREWDPDINLQYNRNRWYDPATGRWMSQDPIGFQAGDQNLYRYVENGPTNKIDPMGKEPIYSDPGAIYDLVHIGWWLYGGEVDYGFFKRMTKDVNMLQCNRGCIGLASFRAGIDQSLYFPWQAENSRMFLTQADAFTYAQDQQKHGNQCTVIAVQFQYGDPKNDKLKPLRPGDSVPPGEIRGYQINEYGDFNFSTYHAGCGKDGKGLWEYMTSGIMTDKNPLVKRVPALPTKYGPPKGFVVICWSKSDKPGPGFVPSFPGCNKR